MALPTAEGEILATPFARSLEEAWMRTNIFVGPAAHHSLELG